MLPKLVLEKMRENHLSLRGAAEEIGVSHTTVARILNGGSVDVDTMEALAKWMNVPLASILDLRAEGIDPMVELQLILGMHPELAPMFRDLFRRITSGELNSQILDEIVAYVKFRTEGFKGGSNATSDTAGSGEGTRESAKHR